MSKAGVEELVRKAITDKDFRTRLFREADTMFNQFDLSNDEKKVLRALTIDKDGDFKNLQPLDEIDPQLVKRLLAGPISANCFTLFVRCYTVK